MNLIAITAEPHEHEGNGELLIETEKSNMARIVNKKSFDSVLTNGF